MSKGFVTTLLAGLIVVSFLLAPATFAAQSGGKLDNCIHVSIGYKEAMPGTEVKVPISISDVTGWGVRAFDITICWCRTPAGLLQYERCEAGPVMLNSKWPAIFCNICGDGCVHIAAASAYELVGGGDLFYLIFHVSNNAKPCMCCDLWFVERDSYIYDPEDPMEVCWSNNKVCIPYCKIYGNVLHWWCERSPCGDLIWPYGIKGARVHLEQCGNAIATDVTDGNGYFEFDCLPPLMKQEALGTDCPYCVHVGACALDHDCINAMDAALILRHLVCLDDLTRCPFEACGYMVYPQQIAADVNCTDVITAYDASLILQYVVHMIYAFPCPDPWVWYMWPCDGCHCYCKGSQSVRIIGVLKGNVSGKCETDGLLAGQPTSVKLGTPSHFDGYVEVPVKVKNAEDIYSAEFEVTYNSRDFEVIDVAPADLTTGFLAAHNAVNGVLNIAMAGSQPFSGNGTVAVVTLQKKHLPIPMASPRVKMSDAMLNEFRPAIEGQHYNAEIVRFALGPVSPNPFREAAVINYSAPNAASVTIDVYNVNGQLVRTVHSGQVEAGTHQVTWDGRDNAGAKVAKGVYFCRMSAEQFNATEKLVILQ